MSTPTARAAPAQGPHWVFQGGFCVLNPQDSNPTACGPEQAELALNLAQSLLAFNEMKFSSHGVYK